MIDGSFGGLDMKKRVEKSEVPSDSRWGVVPAIDPQGRTCITGLARHTTQSTDQGLFDRPWRPAPLRVTRPPRDPVLFLSFHTSS